MPSILNIINILPLLQINAPPQQFINKNLMSFFTLIFRTRYEKPGEFFWLCKKVQQFPSRSEVYITPSSVPALVKRVSWSWPLVSILWASLQIEVQSKLTSLYMIPCCCLSLPWVCLFCLHVCFELLRL